MTDTKRINDFLTSKYAAALPDGTLLVHQSHDMRRTEKIASFRLLRTMAANDEAIFGEFIDEETQSLHLFLNDGEYGKYRWVSTENASVALVRHPDNGKG